MPVLQICEGTLWLMLSDPTNPYCYDVTLHMAPYTPSSRLGRRQLDADWSKPAMTITMPTQETQTVISYTVPTPEATGVPKQRI